MTELLERAVALARSLPAAEQDAIARLVFAQAGKAGADAEAGRIDPRTRAAVQAFLRHLGDRYPVREAILFGSRARQTHTPESDADLALVLEGQRGDRMKVGLELADLAVDVLMETDILVNALPLWEDDLRSPETFDNPALLAAVKREGVRL